jgi:hypothetical protein
MKKLNLLLLFIFSLYSFNAQSQILLPQAYEVLPQNYFVTGISVINDSVIWAVATLENLPAPVPD